VLEAAAKRSAGASRIGRLTGSVFCCLVGTSLVGPKDFEACKGER
jgi:hypothetical protein